MLQDLLTLAIQAHAGTSFSPEKRGKDMIASYSEQLEEDLKGMPEHEHSEYTRKYKEHFSAWLHSKTRIVSTMIAGGSKFPVARMNKYNDWESNKYKAFSDWRDNALARIVKHQLASRPEIEKKAEAWSRISKGIEESCMTIVGIVKKHDECRGCSKPLFVSNLTNRIKTIAKSGDSFLVAKCLELVKSFEEKHEVKIFSPTNSVWKLAEIAEVKSEKITDNSVKESGKIVVNGVEIVQNWQIERIQILFEGKPPQDTISALKKSGWNWSPSNGAWQRKNTNASIYSAKEICKAYVK